MRALEKSAEVVVAKKLGNAGGAKDRRSRTGPMVDSSAGSQLPPKTGRGEAPRTRHGRPTGGARQAGRAEIKSRKERPCTRLERASGDSNRRILKTVRPVVWEGAGAQSPALDPIQSATGKSPLPIGDRKVAAPNRRQESRRSQSATGKSPLPIGGKKAAGPSRRQESRRS